MAKNGLRAGGHGAPGGPPFSDALLAAFERTDTWIHGAFALEQGFIFTSMILAGSTVALIEQRFVQAALWFFAGAALSALGLMHSYAFTPGDAVAVLSPAWPWAGGYALTGALFLAARYITVPGDGAH
jgi:AGZA family xanthine/uracil permease-like MFS transporter